jgi:glycosyltransferase involved in cell wall biosynthesis
MNPKVSINLCCYNSEQYLQETLDSIVNQTYKNWELIIINDGSSDSTESVVHEYIKQGYPIIYHYQENRGLGYSRNAALKYSQGKYLAFIDHDDIWLPEKLEKQVSILENYPEADFLYSRYFVAKGHRKMLASKRQQPQGYVFERFLCHYPVAILTVMIRKESVDRLNILFDNNLSLAEDYDFFLRLLYNSKVIYQKEPLAIYRVHSGMNSLKYMENWTSEIEYVFKKFGKIFSNFEDNYSSALKRCRLELEYSRAKMCMKQGNMLPARKIIAAYKFSEPKYLALYLFSYVPFYIWNFVSLLWVKGPF